jgi:hypothetical protein
VRGAGVAMALRREGACNVYRLAVERTGATNTIAA